MPFRYTDNIQMVDRRGGLGGLPTGEGAESEGCPECYAYGTCVCDPEFEYIVHSPPFHLPPLFLAYLDRASTITLTLRRGEVTSRRMPHQTTPADVPVPLGIASNRQGSFALL